MSLIDTLAARAPQIPDQSAVRGYQSLSQSSERRSVTQNAETAGEMAYALDYAASHDDMIEIEG